MFTNLTEVILLVLLGFSSSYPLFLWLVPRKQIDSGFYNFNLGLSGILGGMGFILALAGGLDIHIWQKIGVWLIIHLGVTASVWNKKNISLPFVSISPLAGLVSFWLVADAVFSGELLISDIFFQYVGNGVLAGVFFAMILGHWYLNVVQLPIRLLRNSVNVLFGLLGLRLLRNIAALLTVTVVSQSGSVIPLKHFLWTFDGFFLGLAMFFGLLVPMVINLMVWRTVRIQSTQSATGLLYIACVSILFGDLFYRFCMFQFDLFL